MSTITLPACRYLTDPCYTDTGANASSEDAEEALDDAAQKVNNILHTFNLKPTNFDKKSYGVYLKGASCPISLIAIVFLHLSAN